MRVGSCISITAAFGYTVHCKMFQCRSYAFALYSVYHLYAQLRNEARIFTISFYNPTPARIPGDIKNGGINICITQCFGLSSFNLTCLQHKITVPGAANTYWGRQWRSPVMIKAMNPFIGKINRDA